ADFHRVIYEVQVAARQIDRARERAEWIEPSLMEMIDFARGISAIDHTRALLARSVLYGQVLKFFESCDLLLTPQMPVPAGSAAGFEAVQPWARARPRLD